MVIDSEIVLPIFKDFIKDFIVKDRQERFLQFLEKEKNWRKLKLEFHTSRFFADNVLVEIKPSDHYSDKIYSKMMDLGATETCISLLDFLYNEKYKFNLKEKLADTVGYLYETVLLCPEKKIAYFEGGHAKDRCILYCQ